jgi:redox-sensitive bicupin YhaK (pirin superfamily)
VKGQQRQVVGVKSGNGSAQTETLIEPTQDGLFAQCITLEPGAKCALPDAAEGDGQYHVVISGSLQRNGATLPPLSVEFASSDEGVVEVEAGPDGLELLLARFPKR